MTVSAIFLNKFSWQTMRLVNISRAGPLSVTTLQKRLVLMTIRDIQSSRYPWWRFMWYLSIHILIIHRELPRLLSLRNASHAPMGPLNMASHVIFIDKYADNISTPHLMISRETPLLHLCKRHPYSSIHKSSHRTDNPAIYASHLHNLWKTIQVW